MTNNELFTFLRSELNGCNGANFIEHMIIELNDLINERSAFEPEKFRNWFIEKNVIYKNSPIAFIKKCGFEDIKNGAFDRDDVKGFNMNPFITAVLKNGIVVVDQYDFLRIEMIELYIIRHSLMKIETLREWNRRAVAHLANSGKTTKDYLSLFEKSRTMKAFNLPLEEIKKETEKEVERWEQLFAELDGKGNLESETKNEEEEYPFDDTSTEISRLD